MSAIVDSRNLHVIIILKWRLRKELSVEYHYYIHQVVREALRNPHLRPQAINDLLNLSGGHVAPPVSDPDRVITTIYLLDASTRNLEAEQLFGDPDQHNPIFHQASLLRAHLASLPGPSNEPRQYDTLMRLSERAIDAINIVVDRNINPNRDHSAPLELFEKWNSTAGTFFQGPSPRPEIREAFERIDALWATAMHTIMEGRNPRDVLLDSLADVSDVSMPNADVTTEAEAESDDEDQSIYRDLFEDEVPPEDQDPPEHQNSAEDQDQPVNYQGKGKGRAV